jgi:hypothetical protein
MSLAAQALGRRSSDQLEMRLSDSVAESANSTTPSTNISDTSPDNANTRKRIFEALSNSLTQTGRKKKHKKYIPLFPVKILPLNHLFIHRSDMLLPYVHAGRWIPRAISPFVNITTVFWVGIAATSNQDGDPDTDNAFLSQL